MGGQVWVDGFVCECRCEFVKYVNQGYTPIQYMSTVDVPAIEDIPSWIKAFYYQKMYYLTGEGPS